MLSFLKPFLIDKTLALNLSWLIAWVLQLPIRKVYKLEWVFFFIRPYSSRGIGIWSYVTELHIKRAKRVVKKAECFFQIENLRTLFNLWLTDIFFLKGFMMQQTAIRLSSHYIAACRQLFFCFWMVDLNAYTNTCLVQKNHVKHTLYINFFTLTCTLKLWVIVWYV